MAAMREHGGAHCGLPTVAMHADQPPGLPHGAWIGWQRAARALARLSLLAFLASGCPQPTRSNDWELNEFWLGSGRKTDGGAGQLDCGYRIDAIHGTNYRWVTSAGFESNWGTNGPFYGIAVPNCYGEASLGDWTIEEDATLA
jgi:hypothetical protein